jgi:hypothetical protein
MMPGDGAVRNASTNLPSSAARAALKSAHSASIEAGSA